MPAYQIHFNFKKNIMQQTLALLKFLIPFTISFYTLSTNKMGGGDIDFALFAGKKVLIVNTAINTADTVQYRKLEQLHQLYKDSLVIIAIPSNDFGNAPMSNAAIKTFVNTRYNNHYILAAKSNVKAPDKSALYKWLTRITKNGMMNSDVKKDFYKYLINKDGILVGVFDNTEDPMGTRIREAVEGSY
jgi:glutathione peroxidase